MTTEREQDERRVYLASVINDTDEFNRELIEQALAHPADVGEGSTDAGELMQQDSSSRQRRTS